jgi:dihydrofolate synthase/folylpolyglutamate synthase
MTYEQTITWLYEQFPAFHLQGVSAYKPSLDNINALSAAFGNPEKSLRFVHIAGTNGKGSTSNMLASVLTESGERTGLFTSPHIHDFRERIRVNGTCIDEISVIDFCEQVRSRTWEIQPSFFEITWLMALCFFLKSGCSIVVAETGLGGRLDATNIITPLVSVITNISLDHTNILGNTRAVIAAEKAGIIKPGIPVVLGEYDAEIAPVIEGIAQRQQSPVTRVQPAAHYPEPLFGYQKINFDTVAAVIGELNRSGFAISTEKIDAGIRNLRTNTGFIGRLEIVRKEPLTILDCAHNAAGILQTLNSITERQQGDLHIVYGTSSDKDLQEILAVLPDNATYYLTEFSNPRSAKLEQLAEAFNQTAKTAVFFQNPLAAYAAAELAANKKDTILIFGSFFLIGDFFETFFT